VAAVKGLPIRTINFDDPADVARHDKIVALVERMLAMHRKLAAAIPTDKKLYQRQIEPTGRQIDALVYELRPTGVPEAQRSGIWADGGGGWDGGGAFGSRMTGKEAKDTKGEFRGLRALS